MPLALVALQLLAFDASSVRNSAVVFLKPHAATDACEAFVREHLTAAGVSLVKSGIKNGKEIEGDQLIDQHYGSLARIAMDARPADMKLSSKAEEAFKETFGIEWAAAAGSMLGNEAAMSKLGVDGLALEPMWRSGVQCKLAPGTYVSRLEGPSEPVYTLNGFYPASECRAHTW